MIAELSEQLRLTETEINDLDRPIKERLFQCWDDREGEMDFPAPSVETEGVRR
jgi:hypothetical protein